ncbi:MAG: hypothetical protein OXT72_03190 [Gammaproteobacteria bacterium]|nr:hypothetical protein [Gammaproteobacteria bacterium]MDE0249263.1 hypothetical protein [Gammaproteobacteria bacterium]
MSPEAWAITGVGVTLAGFNLRLSARLDGVVRDVARIGERLARVEGIIEGWLDPPPPVPRKAPE